MTDYEQLVDLYQQYLRVPFYDVLFNRFFDIENKTNIEAKIKALRYSLDNDVSFMSNENYIELLDLYPKTDIWD